MGEPGEDPRAVAGILLAPAGTAVVHVFEHGEGVFDDFVRFPALDVGDETHAAGIMFELWVIESHGLWDSG
jgi:hypothetical protein